MHGCAAKVAHVEVDRFSAQPSASRLPALARVARNARVCRSRQAVHSAQRQIPWFGRAVPSSRFMTVSVIVVSALSIQGHRQMRPMPRAAHQV